MERPEAALCRAVCQACVAGEQLEEVSAGEGAAGKLVEHRPFGCEAVRTVLGELVRQVARGNVDDATPERICGIAYDLPHTVMRQGREPRDAQAHDGAWEVRQFVRVPRSLGARALTVRLRAISRFDEVKRYEHAPIQFAIAFAQRAGGNVCRLGASAQLGHELLIVRYRASRLRRTEPRERSTRARARCDVEVIGIHDRMRARDHDGVWRKRCDAVPHLGICIDRGLDAALAAMSNLRNDERRVRNGKSSDNRHGGLP